MTLKPSRRRNLRAVHASPAAQLAGFADRLETIVERYYALIEVSRARPLRWEPNEILIVATETKARTISEHGRDTLARELKARGYAAFAARVAVCTYASLAVLIEEAEDVEARRVFMVGGER